MKQVRSASVADSDWAKALFPERLRLPHAADLLLEELSAGRSTTVLLTMASRQARVEDAALSTISAMTAPTIHTKANFDPARAKGKGKGKYGKGVGGVDDEEWAEGTQSAGAEDGAWSS